MDYTWRKWKQRASKWIGNYSNKINLFVNLIKKLESIWFNIIYIDETWVCPQNVTLYSWWHKYLPDPIIRPSTKINIIAAMILPHKYAFMLKIGATNLNTSYSCLSSYILKYVIGLEKSI